MEIPIVKPVVRDSFDPGFRLQAALPEVIGILPDRRDDPQSSDDDSFSHEPRPGVLFLPWTECISPHLPR